LKIFDFIGNQNFDLSIRLDPGASRNCLINFEHTFINKFIYIFVKRKSSEQHNILVLFIRQSL